MRNIRISKRHYITLGLITVISITIAAVGGHATQATNSHARQKRVCSAPPFKSAACHAHVATDSRGNPAAASTPKGLGPAQFRGAYNLPAAAASPAVIAIVDAYNHPNIKSDLDVYNSTFGLPYFPSCSGAVTTGCFAKFDQRGGTRFPKTDSGWALEISLDVEAAHAVCPNCKLVLVEADSSSYTNLMAALDRARMQGATVISNSYGSAEFAGETSYDSHFNYPGTTFTVSSGDSGYGAQYPASSPYVTAVGGTSLFVNADNSWRSESVWSGSGSGCSLYEAKPSFQSDSGCARRTVADVAAVADPYTGAAVYDSVRYQGKQGWFQVGGTSLSAPLIAGMYALGGGVPAGVRANAVPYASADYSANLHDIVTGSNGSCGGYLCQGAAGYDGPTGLGTPLGLGAF